jgi:hypothetical protein
LRGHKEQTPIKEDEPCLALMSRFCADAAGGDDGKMGGLDAQIDWK